MEYKDFFITRNILQITKKIVKKRAENETTFNVVITLG